MLDVRWSLGVIISYPSSMSGIIVKYTGNWARKQGNQVIGFFTYNNNNDRRDGLPRCAILHPYLSFSLSLLPLVLPLHILACGWIIYHHMRWFLAGWKGKSRKWWQGPGICDIKRVCYSHIIDTWALANMKSVIIDKKRTTVMTGGFCIEAKIYLKRKIYYSDLWNLSLCRVKTEYVWLACWGRLVTHKSIPDKEGNYLIL